MAWWPLSQSSAIVQQPVDSDATWHDTMVTASATAHTKGSWVEAIASVDGVTTALLVVVMVNTNSGGSDTSTLLDIGIGGAGSEVVVVADVQVGAKSFQSAWLLPVSIPSGSRIALRSQSAVSSKTVQIQVLPMYGAGRFGPRPAGRCVTYGANASTSDGVVVTPGGSGFGSWVEVSSSTSDRISMIGVSIGPATRTAMYARPFLIEIGVGGAGSEVAVAAFGGHFGSSETADVGLSVMPVAQSIPAGSRISARIASDNSTANTAGVIVHAFTY